MSSLLSESLFFALKRADSNNQPPDAAANTQLNNRGFSRWTDSGGYEYVNRNTISSPTADQHTHVILFQHEPIIYAKLDSDMLATESWYFLDLLEVIAFLDSPLYQGNGLSIGVLFDAILRQNAITITTTVDAVLV